MWVGPDLDEHEHVLAWLNVDLPRLSSTWAQAYLTWFWFRLTRLDLGSGRLTSTWVWANSTQPKLRSTWFDFDLDWICPTLRESNLLLPLNWTWHDMGLDQLCWTWSHPNSTCCMLGPTWLNLCSSWLGSTWARTNSS